MITVAVGDSLAKALKKFQRKVDKAGLRHDLARHSYHLTRRQRRRAREYKLALARARAVARSHQRVKNSGRTQ